MLIALPTIATSATFDGSVVASSDDAEERTGGVVTTTSTDLELVDEVGQPQHVGMRFAGITIPRDATITTATIRFTVDEATSAATNLTIRAQAVDNAATFTTAAAGISSRALTGASVSWTPAAWPTIGASGADQTTPNLASLVQAVVNRPGWTSGNAIVFVVTGSGARIAEAVESGAALAPKLHVEYTTAGPTLPPTITALTPTSGSVGQSIIITGTDLTGATAVRFNGTTAGFSVVDSTRIMATVPGGATSGPVTVTTPLGTGTSPGAFTVTAATAIQVPGDYATIQAAVTAASPGATIQVAPGTYAPFVVDKKLTIESHFAQTNDPATIAATTIASTGSGTTVLIQPTASGTTLRGFTLFGGTTGGPSALDGVRVLTTAYILDNRITGYGDALDFDPPLPTPASCFCQRNTIEGNGDDAIDLDGAAEGVVADNVLRNNGDDGIELRIYETPDPVHIVIRNNRISGNRQDGIQLIDEVGFSNRSFVIDRNVLANNSRAGLGMMDGGITTEDYRAASILDAVDLTNNTFVGNNHGLSGGDNVAGANNIFVGNTVGVKNVDGGSRLTHSLFWNNGTTVIASNVDAPSRIDQDPALDANWQPGPGSPAIDSGTASFVWNGRTVVDLTPPAYSGAAPDRGAIEVQGTDTTPPTITARTPTGGATDVPSSTTITATFSEPMDLATISTTTFTLVNVATATQVPSTVTYTSATRQATLTPATALAAATTYQATVSGGVGGVTDLAGIPLAAPSTWTFTTAASDTTPPQTTITSGPAALVSTATATFAFTANEPGSTFTCRVDGGAGAPCTSPFTVTSLSDGPHVFTVAATDAAGLTDPTPDTRNWAVDTAPPAAPAITNPASGSTIAVASLTLSGTSEPSAAITVRDGASVVGTPTASIAGTWTLTLSGLANGPHVYSAIATDAAGNASPPSASVTVTVSVAAPTQFTFEPEADSWVNQASPATNYGTATTLGTDLNATGAEQTLMRFNVTGLSGPASSARLRVWVTNATDNGPVVRTSSNSWTETAVTWNNRPALDATTVANAGAMNVGAYYEFDVTSAVTGNGLVTFNLVPESSNGLDISSREAATNRPQLVVSGPTAPDLTPPTVVATSPPNTATGVSTAATVAATFSEAIAPATLTTASFTLTSEGGSVPATVSYASATRVATLTPTAPLALNTTYTASLTTTVTDTAGIALAAPVTWTFTTQASDTQPPATTILTGPPSQTSQTGATFTFTSDDATATFRCALDGAPATVCASPLVVSNLAVGAHHLDVVAIDPAGNADLTPATWNWTITTTIVITAQADAMVSATQPTVNFGATTDIGSDGSPLQESLVRFAVTGTAGTVQRAVLRVYVTNVTSNGPAVYLTNPTWTENQVNWNTRPARTSAAIVDAGAMSTPGWYEFNVTSTLTGDGTYSFDLASVSSDALRFSSREVAAQAPQLVITP